MCCWKKETIYPLIIQLQGLEERLHIMNKQLTGNKEIFLSQSDDITTLQSDFEVMLKAITWMLDGAQYLWKD